MSEDLAFRKRLARQLLSAGAGPGDLANASRELTAAAAGLDIPFPPGLAPVPQAIDPEPASEDPLPAADVVVVTWTVDETDALAHVLTPGVSRDRWYLLRPRLRAVLAQIRKGAPARSAGRLAELPAGDGRRQARAVRGNRSCT